ncbi:MAG: hypothetical protein U0936_27040 [Planctomycetaceae bacterium]
MAALTWTHCNILCCHTVVVPLFSLIIRPSIIYRQLRLRFSRANRQRFRDARHFPHASKRQTAMEWSTDHAGFPGQFVHNIRSECTKPTIVIGLTAFSLSVVDP